ncbi:signal peptidase I [Lachnospiraceae bacterium WCA-693-APC-MOT-I]|uniref:Signal peptidase I n=1 Tax=Velocimicrobium porci TaxID=2606634 RepID=A0A6L5XWS8_9FIRM|nr:signal peptidase I [Velocimicrobium porci]
MVSVLRELLIYAIIVVVCIFIIPRYVIQRTIVSGSSMENTLFSDDNLLVEKVSYHFVDPKRFDVVVFYPYGRAAGEYYVKRVIGLPGETIQIKGNDIYINGKKIEEHYGKDPITYQGIASEPLKLGDDEFFLMGDNRKVSFDSRYEEVGPVHRDLLEGKAIIRIWPLKDFGTFD